MSINLFILLATLATHPEDAYVDFKQYLVVIIFSFVIALANRIFDANKLHKSLKILIHYSIISVSFVVLFSSWNPAAFSKPSAYFAAFFLLTIAYWIIFAAVIIFKKYMLNLQAQIIKLPFQAKKAKRTRKNISPALNN